MLLLCLLIAASQAQEYLSNPRCNLQMDRGTCIQFTVQWYYDRWDHRCRRFHYGGCEGNDNRFGTLEECSATCQYNPPSNRDRCFQPHDPGNCDNDIERWFFDMNKKQCVCSWWSGCGGNSNLFYSYNHCMFFCGEYAEHGPGIDEKYWGSRNRSSMSQGSLAIFSQGGSTFQVHSQPHYTQSGQAQQHYQDRLQSYPQGGQSQQHYQDRSQFYPQAGQSQQHYQDRSQSYHQVGQSQQNYPDRTQSYHQVGQSSQDQSQVFGQGGQVHQERSENYPVGDHPYPGRSQSYHQDSASYGQHGQQHRDQEQIARDNFEQALRRESDDTQPRYQQFNTPNGQTVVITRNGPGYRDQRVEHHEWRQNDQPSSRFSEFRSSTSHSSTSHSHFHHSDSTHGYYQRTGWFNSTSPRARGERIYRYDTGPVTKTHPNGTITINRQTIYIAENRQPRMKLVQHLPGLVEFTRITPPPPFLTMIPPALRRKLKKLKKMKIPPRVINPIPTQSASSQRKQPTTRIRNETSNHWNHSSARLRNETSDWSKQSSARMRNETSRWSQSTARVQYEVYNRRNQSSVRTRNETVSHLANRNTPRHRNQTVINRKPQHTNKKSQAVNRNAIPHRITDKERPASAVATRTPSIPRPPAPTRPSSRPLPTVPHDRQQDISHKRPLERQDISSIAPTRVPHVTQPPTTEPSTTMSNPKQIKQVEVKDVIMDAGIIFQSSPPPTTKVEAEPIEIIRPIVTSVPVTKVDFDEVLALDSQYYDDYEEPADEPVEPEESTTESPAELPTSTSSPETPKASQDPGTTLAPIVLPPPDYNVNVHDDRSTNVIPGGEAAQQSSPIPPPRPSSATEEEQLEAEKRLNVLPPTPSPTVPIHVQFQPSPWTQIIVLPPEHQTSTTQMTVGEDYPENVEFEIQTVGIDG